MDLSVLIGHGKHGNPYDAGFVVLGPNGRGDDGVKEFCVIRHDVIWRYAPLRITLDRYPVHHILRFESHEKRCPLACHRLRNAAECSTSLLPPIRAWRQFPDSLLAPFHDICRLKLR